MSENDSAKLTGALDIFPIDQVCQMVASSGRTGVLELALEGGRARIWFEDGFVIAAEFGGRADQAAFNAFCRQKRGTFTFLPGQTAPQKRLRAPVSNLLLEAYHDVDVTVSGQASAPRRDSRPILEAVSPGKRPEAAGRDFVLTGDTLYVFKNLINPLEMNFDISCQKLLASGAKEVIIDLTAVKGINSQYLGVIASVAGAARRSGRTLVVRARGVVAETLGMLGFDQLMAIEKE